MSIVNEIIKFEDGEMTILEIVDFFARIKNSGMLYTLQGMYGRYYADLVGQGYISEIECKAVPNTEAIKEHLNIQD